MRTLHGALVVLVVLGGCSGPASHGLSGVLQPDEPVLGGDEGRLEAVLAHSFREPVCPEPAELALARADHVEEERSLEARAAAQRAQTGEWSLAPAGVTNGTVTLVVGKAIPGELLRHEGQDLLAQWRERWNALAENGLDDSEAMEAGLIDQPGFRMLSLERIDARVRLTHKDNVFGVLPGPNLRTPGGAGLGSTLAELEAAHGPYRMQRIPEPYHCAVHFSGVGSLSFLFRDCERACLGDAVLEVYMGGYDGPEDELPWGASP